MNKIYYCFIFIFLLSFNSYSQKKVDPTSDDKLKAENLREIYPDDSVVLEESTYHITFDLNKKDKKVIVNEVIAESLINIDSRAVIQKYCFYDDESSIKEFKINYRNNKSASFFIKDEAYTSNSIFHIDARVKYANVSFPSIGYRYNTKIRKKYNDIKYFTQLFFNEDYPIEKKTVNIEVPNWLELEFKEINFEGYNIKKDIFENTNNDSKTYTFTLENIPALHDETSAPGPTYVYPHILILAKTFNSGSEKVNIFSSTQDLYDWYKSLVNSLENDNTSIKDKVKSLTENATNEDEKIKNIYYWVQDNIRYIAFEDGIAGFKPDEASNVFNKKYGDCKGMANLTKQMLVEAGFDARLTWIGTKRIAYDYSTPNLSVDNHMICTLIKNDKTIFLDGTEKFNPFGEYANRIQGKQALIENGEEFILKTVPEVTSNFNKETYKYVLNLNNELLEGTSTLEFNGESRSGILYTLDNLKNDRKDEFLVYYLNNGNSNINISNIETTDLLNREVQLNISCDISVKNAVSSFDNDIYIDIDFDRELDEFELEDRKTDYIFDFKRYLESTTILKIPTDYTISHIPESLSVSGENYDLEVVFTKKENVITYKKSFKMKNAKIETSDFEEWNDFISKLKKIYNDQIVLTKQ